MKILGLLRALFGKKRPHRVSFTEEVITRTMPSGRTETVRWDELAEVVIITTDEGPWSEDVYFLLIGADGKSGCAVPQGADGSSELFHRLQELPDFDNEAVVQAMGSTSNARFPCWKRKTT